MADDTELDELRRRKLAELQSIQNQAVAQEQQSQAMEAQRQLILRQVLTPDARERLGRLKTAYPDIAASVEQQLILLAQSGRVAGPIDDASLKMILSRVVPRKRDIRIERR